MASAHEEVSPYDIGYLPTPLLFGQGITFLGLNMFVLENRKRLHLQIETRKNKYN